MEIILPKGKRKNKNPLLIILIVILGIYGGYTTIINLQSPNEIITNGENVTIEIDGNSKIELSDKKVNAPIDNKSKEIKQLDIITVDTVDGGFIDESYDADKDGKGETFPIDTPEAFRDATLNKCISMGNIFGSQCVSLARAYWFSYADRTFSTCGTGKASGAWNCKEQNAGDEFLLITSPNQIQAGDWIIFNGGEYGHVGMALGEIKDGYVALLGENQGGHWCADGGSATNIVNISIKNFVGAYRPKIYDKTPDVPDLSFAK